MKKIIFSFCLVLFVGLIFAPLFNQANADPLPVGSNCNSNADCKSNNCYNKICYSSSSKKDGQSCGYNSECASNHCKGDDRGKNGKCTPEPAPMTPQCLEFERGGVFGRGVCLWVYTPLGAISTQPGGFIEKIFLFLLPAAGAIAVLLMMRSGYTILTSRGNPEAVKEGREQLVAAILGLMFIIFSFVFLQIIARDLLKIPGF